MSEQEDKTRFETLAPWHVNQTLAPADREWVDAYIRAHADAKAELDWYASLQKHLREADLAVDPEHGWAKLQRRIAKPRRASPPSWSARLQEFAESLFGRPWAPRPAFAYAVLALVVVQTGIIGTLMVNQGEPGSDLETRSMPAWQNMSGPVLKINFKPDARESDIRLLLTSVSGTVVGGPGPKGDYFVYVAADQIQGARAKLAASSLVAGVTALPALPPKD